MPCLSYGGAIICRPSDNFLRRRYQRCPTCECITEQVVRFEAWYGVTTRCCRCGERWDGEEGRAPRPFYRYWRRDAVRAARRLWDRATYGPDPTFEQLYPEMLEDPVPADVEVRDGLL